MSVNRSAAALADVQKAISAIEVYGKHAEIIAEKLKDAVGAKINGRKIVESGMGMIQNVFTQIKNAHKFTLAYANLSLREKKPHDRRYLDGCDVMSLKATRWTIVAKMITIVVSNTITADKAVDQVFMVKQYRDQEAYDLTVRHAIKLSKLTEQNVIVGNTGYVAAINKDWSTVFESAKSVSEIAIEIDALYADVCKASSPNRCDLEYVHTLEERVAVYRSKNPNIFVTDEF